MRAKRRVHLVRRCPRLRAIFDFLDRMVRKEVRNPKKAPNVEVMTDLYAHNQTHAAHAHNDVHIAPSTDHTEQERESESYTHGHHESVLRSHRSRNVANSAAYLAPLLNNDHNILDIGCGPGTLTVDLARQVPHGKVTGVDAAEIVIEDARLHAIDEGVKNVEFLQANAYSLPFSDASFDVVHAHQVLQHLSDPVAAIREMLRVVKPGGYIAVRESDYAAMSWFPAVPGLDEWNTLYHEVTAAYGYQADAGRYLLNWFLAAGATPEQLSPSSSSWCYATPESRAWWGGLWAERCVESNFAVQAKDAGLADEVALEELAHDWRTWAEQPDGWFTVPHGEIIVRA